LRKRKGPVDRSTNPFYSRSDRELRVFEFIFVIHDRA